MKRVVVVDDDDIMRKVMAKALSAKGYEVRTYEDGRSFIKTLETGEYPDLLITDILMPFMTGFDIITQAKAITRGKLPIIAFSNIAHDNVVVDALRMGVEYFIAKPISIPALYHMIQRVLFRTHFAV